MSQPVPENTSKSAETTVAENPRASFGAWLRHQREARSVSMREIADNSKISLRYLEALEQDRFDVLPAPVFARGFLREYARVVGLNADEVVNLYLVALEERGEGSRKADRLKPGRPESASSAPSSLGYGLLLGLAVVVFVGIAALLSFLAERRRATPADSRHVAPAAMVVPSSSAGSDRTAGAAGAAGSVAAETGGSQLGEAPASSPEAPASTSTRPGPESLMPAGQAAEPSAQPGSTPAPGPYRVVLNFTQDCWMESVVDGNRRTSELKAAGETVQLEALELVVLTLGNSRAVTVEVEGRPLVLPENSTRVLRDLRIERPGRLEPPPGDPAPAAASSGSRPVQL